MTDGAATAVTAAPAAWPSRSEMTNGPWVCYSKKRKISSHHCKRLEPPLNFLSFDRSTHSLSIHRLLCLAPCFVFFFCFFFSPSRQAVRWTVSHILRPWDDDDFPVAAAVVLGTLCFNILYIYLYFYEPNEVGRQMTIDAENLKPGGLRWQVPKPKRSWITITTLSSRRLPLFETLGYPLVAKWHLSDGPRRGEKNQGPKDYMCVRVTVKTK